MKLFFYFEKFIVLSSRQSLPHPPTQTFPFLSSHTRLSLMIWNYLLGASSTWWHCRNELTESGPREALLFQQKVSSSVIMRCHYKKLRLSNRLICSNQSDVLLTFNSKISFIVFCSPLSYNLIKTNVDLRSKRRERENLIDAGGIRTQPLNELKCTGADDELGVCAGKISSTKHSRKIPGDFHISPKKTPQVLENIDFSTTHSASERARVE